MSPDAAQELIAKVAVRLAGLWLRAERGHQWDTRQGAGMACQTAAIDGTALTLCLPTEGGIQIWPG